MWISDDDVYHGAAESPDDPADRTENPIFLATMHMVFALGSRYNNCSSGDGDGHDDDDCWPSSDTRSALASQFYQSSTNVASLDTIDDVPFEGIQLLLLHAVYLQSTRHGSRCWNVVGRAIRAAQSLALYADEPSPANSQLQREMKRRVWHTCVFFDR